MKNSDKSANRRDFLKLAGAGAPATVIALAAGGTGAAEAAELPTKGAGLRKTEHVKKYLETARF
jgi:anaerobic selenocysteine-containing dehydrogenase